MSRKVFTDRQLLDLIDKSPLMTYQEMGDALGVAKVTVYLRMKKLGIKGEIDKAVKSFCKVNAFKYVKMLEIQAKKGKVDAITKLLELGGVYIPHSRTEKKVESKGQINVQVSRMDFKKTIGRNPKMEVIGNNENKIEE